MWRALFCILGLLSAQDEVVFRANVELIRVDVEVLDGDRSVTGLKREDFIVLDEGTSQPILDFATEDQELDLLLALDISFSMGRMLNTMKAQARDALARLYFRDRVGIVVFDSTPYLVIEPTWDRQAVETALQGIQVSRAGTELNQTVLLAAQYLRLHSRPQTRRGIIVLTDNFGFKALPDSTVRDGLWEADLVLSTVFMSSGFTRMPNYKANLEPFAIATGGDVFRVSDENFDLNESLQRMRKRYSLMYRAPARKPGSVCHIKVQLRNPAHKQFQIRARTGYKAGIPGSEARQKLSLK
ncbi:MAG: VWA domain-containing protein [Acidobacteria bacterium]|nr:VWA domain-containing protein [Acidobacteriota bacterium]